MKNFELNILFNFNCGVFVISSIYRGNNCPQLYKSLDVFCILVKMSSVYI